MSEIIAPQADGTAGPSQETKTSQFVAFISYRHVLPDLVHAKWLQSALESYRVPRSLVRLHGIARRLGRVFTDEEELAASSNLSAAIEEALRASRYLIVVCSPRTVGSQWVNAEVEFFRKLGRSDRILTLLIEGEPNASFPPALREVRRIVEASSVISLAQLTEPLAADLRPIAGRSRWTPFVRQPEPLLKV